ncbi:MAG: TorF family putative porin, partial [Oleibacter sp.]|nr:TorF family putative porin [Thalassolituus sp.]
MKIIKSTVIGFSAIANVGISSLAHAEIGGELTLVSDYLANGISQTQGDPALQGSLEWTFDQVPGAYFGTWASNIDAGEGDDTWLENEIYAGYTRAVNDGLKVDYGIIHYTYYGDDRSFEADFDEIYLNLSETSELGKTALSTYYSWNYSGTDASHIIVSLSQAFFLSTGHELSFVIDRLVSLDHDAYQWDENDGMTPAYTRYGAQYLASYDALSFGLSVDDTNL